MSTAQGSDDDRARAVADADAFFARTYTAEQIARMRAPTTREVARWERDSARVRAAYAAAVADADRAAGHERMKRVVQTQRENRQRPLRAEERKEARRARERERYGQNPEQHRAYQRAARDRAQKQDPERYRQMVNARDRRWYHNHQQRQQQKQRDRYWADPATAAEASARNYEKRKETIKAQRRARYWANREEHLAKQRRDRAREKRRREIGLPVRALHRVTGAQQLENATAAKQFFTRQLTPETRATLQTERFTPETRIARGRRKSARIRVEMAAEILLPQIITHRDLAEARRIAALARAVERTHQRAAAAAAKAAEEERLDAVARQVNARLRNPAQRRAPHHNDPAAPHRVPGDAPARGISR